MHEQSIWFHVLGESLYNMVRKQKHRSWVGNDDMYILKYFEELKMDRIGGAKA